MILEVKYLPTDAQLPMEISSDGGKYQLKMLNGKYHYIDLSSGAFLNHSLSFFEIVPTGREPLQITIGKRVFRLYRGKIYIPEDPSPDEIESLFDYLAKADYEQKFIDIEFNCKIYQCLFDLTLRNRKFHEVPLLLDYGCGTGIAALAASTYHQRLELIGVDISKEMIELSQKNGLKAVKINHDQPLPFESEFFDAAVMAFVSDFLTDNKPYKRIQRVLKEQGRIAFNLYRSADSFREHIITSVLQEAGYLDIEFIQKHVASSTVKRDIWFVVAEKAKKTEE